jgi:hypothetical protein
MQNARDLAWIDTYRQRIFAGTVNHGGNLAFAPHAASVIFGSGFAGLGF